MAEGEHARRWWIAFAGVAAFAIGLSAFAYAGRLPPEFFEADKAIHFGIAGALAFCLDRATGARSLKWMLALLLLFALDEVAQRLSVHRSSNLGDYAADVAGVLSCTALSRLWSKASDRRRPV